MSQTLIMVGAVVWALSLICLTGWGFICFGTRRPEAGMVSLLCAGFVGALGLLTIWSNT